MQGYYLSTRAFFIVIVASLALVVASGCGGSDSSSAAENSRVEVQTGQLSKAEFVKRAEAICGKLTRQFQIEYGAFTTQHEKQFWVRRSAAISQLAREVFAPNYEKRIEEIAALGAPPSDKAEVEAFIRALEGVVQTVRKDPVKASASLRNVLAKPFQAEQRYGLQGCTSAI
jgi:hypothetical protein